MSSITPLAIARINSNQNVLNPVLKVSIAEVVTNASGSERFKLVLNDGSESIIAFMAMEKTESAKNSITKENLIQLNKYETKTLRGSQVVIVIHEWTVVTSGAALNSNPGSGSSLVSAPSHTNIIPIQALNPYNSVWTIRARVTAKSDLRTFSNSRGTGHVFSVDLLDGNGGEIRAVAFNDIAQKLYPVFQANKCYFISNGSIRGARKGFSPIRNDLQISMNPQTKVEPDSSGDQTIPTVKFSFPDSIETLSEFPDKSVTDIVGVVTQINSIESIISKTSGNQIEKREISLADDSNHSVMLTLWGEKAQTFDEKHLYQVVAFKGVRVSDWGTKSLSASSSCVVAPNPSDNRRAIEIATWWEKTGKNSVNSLTPLKSGNSDFSRTNEVLQVKDISGLEPGEKGTYFTINAAAISFIRDKNAYYTAAPEESGTMAKVILQENNKWYCSSNNQYYNSCSRRYVLSFIIADASGSQWVSAYDSVGQAILGMTADELHSKYEENENEYLKTFGNILWSQYTFDCMARIDSYEGNDRLRVKIQRVRPIDPVSDSQNLIKDIGKYGFSA